MAPSRPPKPSSPPAPGSSTLADQVTAKKDVRARLLAGPDVVVIDISPNALVIEADVRLKPASGIRLTVTIGNVTHQASGRVTTVDVALMGGVLKYRAHVELEADIPAFDLRRR